MLKRYGEDKSEGHIEGIKKMVE